MTQQEYQIISKALNDLKNNFIEKIDKVVLDVDFTIEGYPNSFISEDEQKTHE